MDAEKDLNSNEMKKKTSGNISPFMIGVAGGTASGKSTVCEKIMETLRKMDPEVERQVVHLTQDSFYRELKGPEKVRAAKGMFNFDHPDAFDNQLMENCLQDIINGKTTKVPTYDMKTNSRLPGQFTTVQPSLVDVVLFEGILTFYNSKVRNMFNMKVFIDTDADSRLSKRVLKDVDELGRDLDQVLQQYIQFVKPAFEEFCMPTKKFADVIIPRGPDNKIAIELISQHIVDLLSTSPAEEDIEEDEIPLVRESRRRHFSDTSNMYNASRRLDLKNELTRPH